MLGLHGIILAIVLGLCVGFAGVRVALVAPAETFWLKVSPQVLSANASVRLTCHVPRSEDNRWVELGVQNYRASTTEMDGAYAPQTFELLVQHVPCEVGAAYCRVGGIPGSRVTGTTLPLLVSGCE